LAASLLHFQNMEEYADMLAELHRKGAQLVSDTATRNTKAIL
jgi:hypothetical protein